MPFDLRMKMKRLGGVLPRGAPKEAGKARAPAPRADCLRKFRLVVMVLFGLLGFAVEEGIGGEEGEDDGIEATTTFEISHIGVDQCFGIGKEFVAPHEIAEGMTDDGLTDPGGLAEAFGEIDGVFDLAIEGSVSGSPEISFGVDGKVFVGVAEIDMVGGFVGPLFDEVVGMLERFLKTIAAEIIEDFKRVTEGVHALVTAPAIFCFGDAGEAGTKSGMMIVRDFGFDGDGDVGDGACEEFFANPLSPDDGVGLGVLSMGNQPGGMGEDAFPVFDLGGLLAGVVPVVQLDVVEFGDFGAAQLKTSPGRGIVEAVSGEGDEGRGSGFALIEAESEAG